MTSTPNNGDNTAPVVSLSATPISGTAPYSSVLNATATDPDGDPLSYMWTTPEGTVSGSNSFTYAISTAGSYPIIVTVSDGNLSASQSVTLSATAAPVVPGNHDPIVSLSATPSSGDAPLEVTFTASGSDLDGDPLSYVWTFGDGEGAGNTESVTHRYTKAGSYKAKVTVSDGRGGTDSVTQTVTVKGNSDEPDPVIPDPAGSGTIKLDVTPNGSSWTVGEQQGVGDKTITLPTGDYTLAVEPPANSPFTGATQPLSVTQGQSAPLTVSLEPIAGVTYSSYVNFSFDQDEPGIGDGSTFTVDVTTDSPYTNITEVGLQAATMTLDPDLGAIAVAFVSVKPYGEDVRATYRMSYSPELSANLEANPDPYVATYLIIQGPFEIDADNSNVVLY